MSNPVRYLDIKDVLNNKVKDIINSAKENNLGSRDFSRKTKRMTSAEIAIINTSRSKLTPAMPTRTVPSMLKKKKEEINALRTSILRDNAKLTALEMFLFKRKSTRHNVTITTLRVAIKGRVVKGLVMPIRGYNSFINNPINIESAILKPTENKIASVLFIGNRKILSRIVPGINKR